jgi:hypothetical protein
MNFTRQQHQSHKITTHIGGSRYFCAGAPGTRFLFAQKALPGPDDGRPISPDAFSLAARSLAGRGWSGMIYGSQGTVWEGRCSTGNSGTWPATERCGGRGGASPFPVKGRRTWGSSTCMSTSGRWGVVLSTWMSRRSSGGCCRR